MKRILALALAALMLTGCGSKTIAVVTETTAPPQTEAPVAVIPEENSHPYESRFADATLITLSDEGITVEGNQEAVFTSNDIVYYEDKDAYESGNPYGDGESHEKHSAEEAAAHTVVNITQPGAYTLTGTLSAGQIRVDLGLDAYEDPNAVVELNLMGVDITCTVAPAILFQNVYECDGNWSEENAKPDVDTSAAGANLILDSGGNRISGSHVAKIFKDKDGEKKLWKQDGAIYSYMSMNVFGPGALELTADNEGMDTELHLTINGGDINIYSDNDGINTNEDNVSVTTINGGNIRILAGLGKEGDGIDSNGYLVINGGTVISMANPAADAGLDSDLGSFIHGGTVIALGSTMDWAESDSRQVTMNLQFAQYQTPGSTITITDVQDSPLFTFAPAEDPVLKEHLRQYRGVIFSSPALQQGQTCHVYVDSVQMQYTGTDLGGFGPGRMPGGFGPGQMPEGMEFPDGFTPGEMPEGMAFPDGFTPGEMPEGFEPGERGGNFSFPQDGELPEGFDPSQFGGRGPNGQDRKPPEGFGGERPSFSDAPGQTSSGTTSTEFYMTDMVNAFSGIAPVSV